MYNNTMADSDTQQLLLFKLSKKNTHILQKPPQYEINLYWMKYTFFFLNQFDNCAILLPLLSGIFGHQGPWLHLFMAANCVQVYDLAKFDAFMPL